MKAAVYTEYGPPEVLQIKEVEKPVPRDNEVLVKIIAAAVNPVDSHMIRGEPKFSRITFGLTKPKNLTPGMDVAGRIEAVGRNVKEFRPEDEVFGDCGWGGGFAEYICVNEERLEKKPANISFEEAATISIAGITAIQSLRDKGKIQTGQKVLIVGASGGVGLFAVQIAKYFDAEVTGVCSTINLDLVRSIGADKVIDYTKEDFASGNSKYDLILDNVANRSIFELKHALNPNGICVVVGFTTVRRLFQLMFFGSLISFVGKKKIIVLGNAKPNKIDHALLKEFFEKRIIKPIIEKRYKLSEVREAIRHVETGHTRGKLVINISI